MGERLLIDTDVLIDYSRRLANAAAFMRGLQTRPVVSAVTISELYAGVREGRERSDLDAFAARSVIIDVDAQVAERAGLWLREYRRSHNTGLADALIAATAEAQGARLVSLNRKHYPMLADVLVPYAKP